MTERRTEATPACTTCGYQCEFRRAGIATGFHICAWCSHCGRIGTPNRIWYPKSNFSVDIIEEMPWLEDGEKAICKVCGALAHLEAHHLAPREFFGKECELWPVVEVCAKCHCRWHEKMGRPIRRRLAEAAE